MNAFRFTILFVMVFITSFQAQAQNYEETPRRVLQIIKEQHDSIEAWVDDRLYIVPERMSINRKGIFLCKNHSMISLPSLRMDKKGVFIHCQKKDVSKEAQEHYDKATSAAIEALICSISIAPSLEIPPLVALELYKAVDAWKEAAREYNAGVECEREGTYCRPEGKSSLDD